MQISQILDFTKSLPERQNSYSFNPSIAKWKDDLYLCCYRNFNRYQDVVTSKYRDNPFTAPNHPWLGSEGSSTWWSRVDGNDDTGFILFSLRNNRLTVETVFNPTNSYNVRSNGEIVPVTQKHLEAVDARLVHLTGDFFLTSYNKYTREDLNIKTNNCERIGCFLIATRLVRLRISKTGSLELFFYPENILCPQISNSVEKNWSFWVYQEQMFFSYGLTPGHEVYKTGVSFSTGQIICDPNVRNEFVGFYGNFEKFYNQKLAEKSVFISVTTPALPLPRKPNRYIGVGHIKYKNSESIVRQLSETPLANFWEQTQKYKRHPVYDYLMFIYEFEPVTGNLLQVSDFFLPSNTDYILAFPSGIEFDSRENLLISYGDHDSFCKLLIIRGSYLTKLLKPVQISPTGQIVSPLPNRLSFSFMPINCLNREGLCNLLLY